MESSLSSKSCCEASISQNPSRSAVNTKTLRPRVNIFENESSFLLEVDMPGVDESAAEVIIEKNLLTIKGKQLPVNRENYRPVYGVTDTVAFERTFQVPEGIDREALSARMKNGVLEVTIPKAQQLQAKKIQIQAG